MEMKEVQSILLCVPHWAFPAQNIMYLENPVIRTNKYDYEQ